MDEKQAKTLKRVVRKLSALRGTLTRPEAAILDALIVREPEVTGHAMIASAMEANAMKAGAVSANAQVASAIVANVVIGVAASGYIVEI